MTPVDDTNVRNRGSVSFDQFGHLQIPNAKITNIVPKVHHVVAADVKTIKILFG